MSVFLVTFKSDFFSGRRRIGRESTIGEWTGKRYLKKLRRRKNRTVDLYAGTWLGQIISKYGYNVDETRPRLWRTEQRSNIEKTEFGIVEKTGFFDKALTRERDGARWNNNQRKIRQGQRFWNNEAKLLWRHRPHSGGGRTGRCWGGFGRQCSGKQVIIFKPV